MLQFGKFIDLKCEIKEELYLSEREIIDNWSMSSKYLDIIMNLFPLKIIFP